MGKYEENRDNLTMWSSAQTMYPCVGIYNMWMGLSISPTLCSAVWCCILYTLSCNAPCCGWWEVWVGWKWAIKLLLYNIWGSKRSMRMFMSVSSSEHKTAWLHCQMPKQIWVTLWWYVENSLSENVCSSLDLMGIGLPHFICLSSCA